MRPVLSGSDWHLPRPDGVWRAHLGLEPKKESAGTYRLSINLRREA